jgi:hypothetical protein
LNAPPNAQPLRWALLFLDEQIAGALIAGEEAHAFDEWRCFAGLGVMRTREVARDLDRARIGIKGPRN